MKGMGNMDIVKAKKGGLTIDDLESKIEDEGGLSAVVYGGDTCPSIIPELTFKVNVDFENTDYIGEYDMPGAEYLDEFEVVGEDGNAFPVAWCAAGGDWEKPLVFVLYIGEDDRLHGYIPSDGNGYNHMMNCAYGSEPISMSDMEDDDLGEDDDTDNDYVFDAELMRREVQEELG